MLEDLADAMLDQYTSTTDYRYRNTDVLKEITLLCQMKCPKIYKKLLRILIEDIDKRTLFDIDHLKSLSVVLLNAACLLKDTDIKKYCKTSDIKDCLNLIARKINIMLVNKENEHLHEIIDALNILLTVITSINL